MHFSDSHIHLQAYSAKTAPQIIEEAAVCGVHKLICPAITEADWPQIATFAEQFADALLPAFGLHPWYLEQAQPGWEERLAGYLRRFPKAAIGETGLDRHHNLKAEPQKAVFATHIKLARQFSRPLLIHAVKANDWLADYWPELAQVRFVFHSYNGRAETLKKVVAAGGYISFSNSVLENRDFAKLATAVPAERLLVETDGPFQGLAGAESHPCQIPALVEKIALARGEDMTTLAAKVETNIMRFIDG